MVSKRFTICNKSEGSMIKLSHTYVVARQGHAYIKYPHNPVHIIMLYQQVSSLHQKKNTPDF